MNVHVNEISLWNGLRSGDEADLRSLYGLYYNDLLRYGLHLTNDAELSKAFINYLFLSLWNNRQKLPEVKNPKAYIITSYKNRIFFRKKRPGALTVVYIDTDDDRLPTVQSYEETLIELQEYEILKQKLKGVLALLTARQQQIITLRFIEELTYEQIAAQLSVSVRTVYNSIHESLKLLRGQVRKNHFFLLLISAIYMIAHANG